MNPYMIIGLLAAWVASLIGVGYWQNEAGQVAERDVWQTRENKELRTANATIKTLEEDARKAEQDKADALNTISTSYERELSDAKKQRALDVAAVRAGSLRLRDPSPTGLRAYGNIAAEATSGPGQRDGGAARELSDPGDGVLSAAASGFILDLANEADDIVSQLTACQQVVIADREVKR